MLPLLPLFGFGLGFRLNVASVIADSCKFRSS